MSEYTRRTWSDGEVITAEKLNNLETGVTEAKKEAEQSGVSATNALNYAKKVGAPRNLIYNSDFLNPVNQRGMVEYRGAAGYTIDRWKTTNMIVVTLQNDGVGLACVSQSVANGFTHVIETPPVAGTTVTLAAMENDGTLHVGRVKVPSSSFTNAFTTSDGIMGRIYPDRASIMIPAGKGITLKWVALYEGEYTAETLPEFQSNKPAAELLECQRCYLYAYGGWLAQGENSVVTTVYIPTPTEMRIDEPTVTVEEYGYVVTMDGTEHEIIAIEGCVRYAMGLRLFVRTQTTVPHEPVMIQGCGVHISADY